MSRNIALSNMWNVNKSWWYIILGSLPTDDPTSWRGASPMTGARVSWEAVGVDVDGVIIDVKLHQRDSHSAFSLAHASSRLAISVLSRSSSTLRWASIIDWSSETRASSDRARLTAQFISSCDDTVEGLEICDRACVGV